MKRFEAKTAANASYPSSAHEQGSMYCPESSAADHHNARSNNSGLPFVPDAAEEPRVGERALQRVVLARERLAEGVERRVHDLEALGVVAPERVAALEHVERRALPAPHLGQEQRAVDVE